MKKLVVKSRLAVLFFSLVLILSATTTSFAGGFGASFVKSGNLPGANVNDNKFYSTQGVAFDTYSRKDMYVITLSSLNKKNAQLTHMRFNNGTWTTVKSVIYKNNLLGHANDATVFMKGKTKYLFVAKGGDGTKTACMVKLSDFNKGIAKTYKVKFSKLDTKSGADLRGISYCGNMKVKVGKKKVKKDVFIVETGRRINKVYLKSIKNNVATFAYLDSQRIKAPVYKGREGTANGIVYHKGNIFCVYADEGNKGENRTAMIEKIGMSSLFNIKNSNTAKKFPYSWKKTYDYTFTPEGLFFFSLNGKTNMFMTCNGGSGSDHRDYIFKTTQKY